MKRVTGLGGVFFKAKDPQTLGAWYKEHLGLEVDPAWNGCAFPWRYAEDPTRNGQTVWSAFKDSPEFLGPAENRWMINYRVENLDEVLAALRAEGVWVDENVQDSEYGRFGWVRDPEGNRIELWQPPAGQ